MYWIYLTIFVLIVFAPEIIQREFFVLSEDDFEAVVIFLLGMIAFLLYLVKERELGRVVRDLLRTRRQANIASEDLQETYSYIGEMNRKIEVLRRLFLSLPETLDFFRKTPKEKEVYQSVFDALGTLSKAKSSLIRIVDIREKRTICDIADGKKFPCDHLSSEHLVNEKSRRFWLDGEVYVAASTNEIEGHRAFLLFPKNVNAIDDSEMIKVLASQALFLYFFSKRCTERERKDVV